MPLLKEVPREVKEGKKRERRWVRQLWVKKNWIWAVPACVVAIVALVLLIIGIVWYSQRRACYAVHLFPSLVTEIHIEDGKCNYKWLTVLSLSQYKSLKSVEIGDGSYMYVKVLNITGLNELESVVIGENSFTKNKNWYGNNPNRHFYLKNCPKLKSLKMGRYSFSDYSVIEIENVDALEVIEMGDLNEGSLNFVYASLELKSILIQIE